MKRLAIMLALVPATAHADKIFADGQGGTHDCADDPVVEINHGKGVYTFKGACTSINLNGGESKVTIAKVESINVNGASNKITIGELGELLVNGDKNSITWKKAITGTKPNVIANGKSNKISKVK